MTISDIARMAGVSSAAVSRYLNGGPLSAEKRAAIHLVIEKTGYAPDAAAQTLRTGKVNQIGVITPNISSQSVGQVITGISQELDASRYLMLLVNTELRQDRELNYLAAMQRNYVAGVILMGTVYTPALAQALRECRVPVVITGQRFPEMSCVYNDDRAAACELTARMIARGRRHLGYIAGPEKDVATGYERRLGVEQALEEAGLDRGSLHCVHCSAFTLEEGARCMEQLLQQSPELDGVICVTDVVALGAWGVLRKAGRQIGQDIGLAGIGDSWASAVVEPGLATVQFQQQQVGVEAARMLVQMIGDKAHDQSKNLVRQMTLGYTVLERGSL